MGDAKMTDYSTIDGGGSSFLHMTLRRYIVSIITLTMLHAGPTAAEEAQYQLGRGLKVNDGLIVGGYFSTEYANGDDEESFVIDDLAILVYGTLASNFTYLAELESKDFYKIDFENDTEESNTDPFVERLYGDYKHSDQFSIRFGKQITPIGYWNLQPINVLRDTTSSPMLSKRMFPKFLSGLDVYGYTPFSESLTYHLYMQATEDLDTERINIDADSHYGISLEKYLPGGWQLGGSLGVFTEKDDSRTHYIQLNSKLDLYRYTLLAEAIFNYKDPDGGNSEESEAFYIQGEYRIHSKHALIARIEYFNDDAEKPKERIGILGYSYRPVYPVSFKIEYQWHADTNSNRMLSSFSVLF